MTSPAQRAVAIVGVGAIFPDAPDAGAFWANVRDGHYAISDVDPARWDPALYYDADHKAPDMTYSTIGGWVREWEWNPLAWKLPIPPRVGDGMDDAQKWAVACTRTALMDYGWPDRPLDLERTAVVLGNAMAGEKHYLTCLRLAFPELARDLDGAPSFAALAPDVRAAIASELHARMQADLPPTNEDTMPGELGNCLAGRVANLFNLRGPNFVIDAACASAMAAMDASIQGLLDHQFDSVITGGVDRNMGVNSFIKFCAIGALSSTGTRPYSDGADGFVMGEGAGLFLLKRLADAERDGDRIYAVVRGMAGSSDGKGKGLTAPNPIGQKLAIERAWRNSGLSPAECSLMEGHGTSTAVGDYVELSSLAEAFAGAGLAPGSIALGSVKSNIGHLKSAAGAAGMLKATLAIYHKALPPSLGFVAPNPNADWSSTPFAVNTELRDWEVPNGTPRVAGVSAFGFGGTNYHAVIEEYVPGRLSNGNGHATIAVPADVPAADTPSAGAPVPAVANGKPAHPPAATGKPPLRGVFLAGAADEAGLATRLRALVESGDAPPPTPAAAEELGAAERICIDYGDAAELFAKAKQALKAIESGNPAAWKALQGRGIFRGSGAPGKVAFLYTGQGSQYANMLAELRRTEPIVAATFDEADVIMRPLLGGRALSDIIFVGPEGVADAEAQLMRTEITQPAVLTVDIALTRLLAAYGIEPDLVMGHSLGEYGALVAAGIMSFGAALEAVSARGRGMANLTVGDPGALAAVSAPLEAVEQIIAEVDGYLVLANVNSPHQLVLGGDTDAVDQAVAKLIERGERATRLPVSHAFHTRLVAGVTEPLRATLERMTLSPARIPVVANVDGEFYPTGPGVEEQIVDTLARQVASPVQFVKGLNTLYDAGARVLVETGPKRALWGFAADVLGDDVMTLFTNHPKVGELASFNQALCGLYAAGVGAPSEPAAAPVSTSERPARDDEPVVITGAAAGTPGTEKVFDDGNLSRLLHGEQFIHAIPARVRREIAERHITRLVKGADGTGTFQTIDDPADVIKLAGRAGEFDLSAEFGIDADRLAALGRETQLAVAAGIDALRDAGIPLIQHYKDTTRGTKLPDKWRLPDALRDDTGVIFASAFPGSADFAGEMNAFWTERVKRARLEELSELRDRADAGVAHDEIERRIAELELDLEQHPYQFDRRFLFRVLSMGHSQLAELIGARGPNTQINAACASTTQAISIAEDWIRAGRCRRVLIVAGDDVTSEALLPWVGSGFLASGAAATDELVEDAALPFDRRRHGMILGMGAAGIVVESAAAARERGVTPICEVLGAVTANSAFHGSRLDADHIGGVMESLVRQAEARGVTRDEIAPETLFVSHETYTPARGGSASAEIHALRHVFGDQAEQIVVANTKGTTGHTMGVGVEDIVAIKALETGLVPAVPNFREIDPDLGALNLSKGGQYPVRYALRLAAGFGSQISMTLLRWTPVADGRHRAPEELGYQYRIADQAVWKTWLRGLTSQAEPQLEIVKRHLRVVDTGPVPAAATNGARTPVPVAASAPVTVPMAVAPPVPVAASAPVIAPVAVAPPVPVVAPAPVTALAPVIAPAPAAASTPVIARVAVAPPVPVAAVPVAAVAPVIAAEPAAAVPTTEEITAAILEIVAAQTGYPADMLDPELDLEADLGIDTVKQAEMFAAVREQYAITRDDNLNLRDYPTLRHVVGFVEDRTAITPATPAAASAPVIDPAPAVTPPAAPATAAPAPVAASEPVIAAEPAAAAAPTTEEITAAILEIVAAQTGYPADMLDPDLDLEADLGIDTVKQAEMFAAVREQYAITRDDNLNLRDYPTLRHVVGFVEDRTHTTTTAPAAPVIDAAPAVTPPAPVTTAAPAPVAAAVPAPVAAAVPTTEEITAAILEIVAAQTGYPADMLDPDLDLEADLGIDTVKQAEMFAAVRAQYAITRDDNLNLRDYPTLRHVVGFVEDRTRTTTTAPAAPVIDAAPAVTPPAAPATAAPAPVAASEPVIAAEPAAAAVPTTEEITAAILEIVAAQTGYPADMLDPELDLEADLGIDTVKQAEMFAAVRERYAITRDDNLNLRDYPTLRHVVGFVEDRTRTTTTAPAAPVIDAAPAVTPPAAPATAAPAPVAASEPVIAAEPAAAAAPTTEEITAAILEIVAAQTGYPADMLDPDLDLEADLGIDTVKQAEMFAAVRAQYAITRDDNLNLRDYPTLRHVVGFVEDRTHTTATRTPEPAPVAEPLPEPGAFPRRVPVPVLRPPLAACVDTGVTLRAGVRVVLMPDQGGVAAQLAERLVERGVEVLALDPALAGDAVEARLAEWSATGPIGGVYWLPALDEEGPLAALEPGETAEALRVRVKLLAVTMRALTGGFLVSGTRLGGRHGYDAPGATSALGGAVTGFTKSLARERPDTLVKAVDFASGGLAAALADLLIEETLRDPGAIEIGHADELRWSVGLIEEPTRPEPGRALTRDTVFVVTGAAGSIVSAITADLAAACTGGTFHLLDLVPTPDAGDPDLERFDTDPDGLKRDLAERLRARGERPTPKLVDRELARIERARAALAAVTAIERAGGDAHWYQVDLTDPDAVAAALAGIDRVDVLMHAAGLEISHYLPDKPQAEFDLVFDVKAGGWLNLLRALRDTPIGSAVVFSSIAGRFGNAGQTDYAAANDLLCKSVSQLRRSGTRGIALDWTAWAGIGMASRGSIPKMMEAAGIDMLPSAAGVPVVRRELTGDAPGGEVVVAGALGVMLEERHATGGLDPVRAGGAGPMTGRITAMTLGQGLTVRTELDPDRQPFLHDHRIDGTPVLPGVMGMEAFAEASRVLLDGWQVVALEDVDLLAPVKFYRDEPRTLELHAQIRDGGDGTMVADCELVGRRPLPGQAERETRHFTGRARLSRTFAVAPQGDKPESAAAGRPVVGHAELYRVYFHGPAYQVLGSAWRENGHVIGTLAGDLPPGHEPALPATLFLPRLIELCFQTLGVWEIGTTGRMWLPSHVDRVLRYAGADEPGPLWAVVTPRDGGADADVVDADGRVRVRLEGYRTIELPGGMDDDALAPLRDAMADR